MHWAFSQVISCSNSHWALTLRQKCPEEQEANQSASCLHWIQGLPAFELFKTHRFFVYFGFCRFLFLFSDRGHVLYFIACYCFKKYLILSHGNFQWKTWIKIPVEFTCLTALHLVVGNESKEQRNLSHPMDMTLYPPNLSRYPNYRLPV